MRDRQRRIEDLIEPRVYEFETLRNERDQRHSQKTLFRWAAIVPAVMFFGTLIGAVIEPTLFFFALCGLLLAVAGGAALRLFVLRAADGKLAQRFNDLRTQAARLGFEMTTLDGLLQAKGEFERQFDEAKRVADGVRVNYGAHKKHIEAASRGVRDVRQEMDEIERAIASLKIDSGVPDVGDYRAALGKKNEYISQEKYLGAMLGESLGLGGDGDPVEFWEQQLTRRLDDLFEDEVMTYDAGRERELRDLIEDLEETATQTDEALESGRQALRDFESKVRNAGVTSPFVCRTLGELRQIERNLVSFIDVVLAERDDAQLALSILEEIETEEKTKVIELFGEDKAVSAYFKRITDNKYDQVRFNPDVMEMSVHTPVGEWLSAQKLSGGALDQLYFAVRLSIAESIFGEERGFFILDDPFIKSDINRLKNQVQLLKTMAASGWQVLYFSAKKEVHDLLKADILAKRVGLIRLDTEPAVEIPTRATRPVAPPARDLFSDGPTY
jgi:uncharacterized protein YhaN